MLGQASDNRGGVQTDISGVDFLSVTELAGDEVSREQIERIYDRYHWATTLCSNLDVVETACGTGQGLGYLKTASKSLLGGDVSAAMIGRAKAHYGDRIDIGVFDACNIPRPNRSTDVVILFEALYYLPDIDRFIAECKRVLRPGGKVLITTANKDLFDFNPSPFSHEYLGVVELNQRFSSAGFSVKCFGSTPIEKTSVRQKILRPVKKAAVSLGLVPKTMAGKKLLKRLIFGGLEKMPIEISATTSEYHAPTPIASDAPSRDFKVIYCEAVIQNQ